MLKETALACAVGLALLAGCGDDDGDGGGSTQPAPELAETLAEPDTPAGTPNADRVERCMDDLGYGAARTPQETGDVGMVTTAKGKSVVIYVAEGSTDPKVVYKEAVRIERERYEFEESNPDSPQFGKLVVVRRRHTVFSIEDDLKRSVRKRIVGCGV